MSSSVMQSPIQQRIEVTTVQVDLGTMEGSISNRVKAPPVCVDATLKQQGMSAEELEKFSFPKQLSRRRKNSICEPLEPEPSVVSSSSSTASRESALSDVESKSIVATPLKMERRQSSQINLKVTNQKTSRSGRQTQRWHTDPTTQRVYRMVTGCVPIVEGGRVLLVSASRKPEWILPKGGWEKDEGMEESAIRECFEEAGVLGLLGPRLKDFDYETKKAKKRRLEFEEHQRKVKLRSSPKSTPVEMHDETSREVTPVGQELFPKPLKVQQSDETCSVASDCSFSHTHVRLSLFVLYVSDVKSDWPESGRSRKVVDLDEAIKMCENRPEFLAALKEVKERNLQHLPKMEKLRLEER